MSPKKERSTRFVISIALFIAALIASFLMSITANQRQKYWVAVNPVAAGSQVQSQDLSLIEVTLGNSHNKYLPTSINPVGAIASRKLSPGELIPVAGLVKSGDIERNEEISLSMRSVDIPTSVAPGSLIHIFQVHDEKNGAPALEPFEVIHGAHVSSLDRKGSNFGGEVALTIATSPRFVERLLAASTSGRLVAVLSYE
jgi:cytochrome c-type biogenesis protein CcmE